MQRRCRTRLPAVLVVVTVSAFPALVTSCTPSATSAAPPTVVCHTVLNDSAAGPVLYDAPVANNPARERWRAALLPRRPRMRSREPRAVDPFVSSASGQGSAREGRTTGGCCPGAERASLCVPADRHARRQSRGVSRRETEALAARM